MSNKTQSLFFWQFWQHYFRAILKTTVKFLSTHEASRNRDTRTAGTFSQRSPIPAELKTHFIPSHTDQASFNRSMKRNKPHQNNRSSTIFPTHPGYCGSSGSPINWAPVTNPGMGKASCTSHKKSSTTDIWQPLGKGYGTNQSNAKY